MKKKAQQTLLALMQLIRNNMKTQRAIHCFMENIIKNERTDDVKNPDSSNDS